MNFPKVSVLITYYNQKQYIQDSLNSVLKQKVSFPIEILCGDDGSTDGTYEELLKYTSRFPDVVKVFRMPRDNGKKYEPIVRASNNRYSLIKNATGKYITILDGDDYYTDENKLQSQFDALETPKLEGDELAEIKDSDKDSKILERYGIEGGISVGYSYKLLKELRPKKEASDFLSIGKVEYTNGKSAKCLNDSSKQIAKLIKNEIKNKHKIDESNSIWKDIQLKYEEAVIKTGVYIKNKFFKEENEWRLCHWGPDYKGPNTEVMPLAAKNILLSDKNDPKRHYEIQFNKNIDKYIKKIIIGPKCSMSKEGILKLLKDNGIKLSEDYIKYSKGYGVYVESKNQK